jgi:hypothetical protein
MRFWQTLMAGADALDGFSMNSPADKTHLLTAPGIRMLRAQDALQCGTSIRAARCRNRSDFASPA